MPIYEFKCEVCGEKFEELCRRTENSLPCPACGSKKTSRLFSVFAAGNSRAGQSCAACSGSSCSTCR